MRNSKYGNELKLLLLLTENRDYTIAELAKELDVTGRSIYYYMEYLENSGFKVVKNGRRYRLDRNTQFFQSLHENISLNRDEALYMHRMLSEHDPMGDMAMGVRSKLERFYNLDTASSNTTQKRMLNNVRKLDNAIKNKKMVVLKNYSSPHSHTIADRIVEPFQIFSDGTDLRCYEPKSKMNKTFKLSRMEDVEVLDDAWSNEKEHKSMYTDLFLFSGEQHYKIELMLGQLSYNLLMEEYPMAACCVAKRDDQHWYFATEVVSYIGIGRFVLGLYEDIEVLGDDGFKAFLAEKIEKMKSPATAKAQ